MSAEQQKPGRRPLHPVALVAITAIGGAIGALPWACGARQGQSVTAAIQCRLDALRVLPEDVGNATVYDAIDIIERIKECGRKYPEPDAGKP